MENKINNLIGLCVERENGLFKECAIWRKPIVGYVGAHDPRMGALRDIASKSHLLPADVLPNAKSVICFFIPFAEEIGKSNIGGELASKEWAVSYIRTNALIAKIGDEIESVLNGAGYSVGKIPATHNFDGKTLVSNWSHRHLAYLSGIGSFGVNNMLITDRGCCGRLGSVVTDYPFTVTVTENKERCLNKINGYCGLCRRRCVGNAYTDNGFNRFNCYDMCLKNAEHHKGIGLADVCGKCVVGLPCSFKDPANVH